MITDKCQQDLFFNNRIAITKDRLNYIHSVCIPEERDLLRRGIAWMQHHHWTDISLWPAYSTEDVERATASDLIGQSPVDRIVKFICHVENWPHFLDGFEPRIYFRT